MGTLYRLTLAAPNRDPDDVIVAYCTCRKLRRDQLSTTSKAWSDVWPRHELSYLLSRMTRLSNQQIGMLFGGRDHTTVANSINRVENRRQCDPIFDAEYLALEAYAIAFMRPDEDAIKRLAGRVLRGEGKPAETASVAVCLLAIISAVGAPDLSPAEKLTAIETLLRHAPENLHG